MINLLSSIAKMGIYWFISLKMAQTGLQMCIVVRLSTIKAMKVADIWGGSEMLLPDEDAICIQW